MPDAGHTAAGAAPPAPAVPDPFAHLLDASERLMTPAEVDALVAAKGARGRRMNILGVKGVLDKAEELERGGGAWGVSGVIVKGRRTTLASKKVVKLSVTNLLEDELKVIVNAREALPEGIKVGAVVVITAPGSMRQLNPFTKELQFCLTVEEPAVQVHVVGHMGNLGFCEMPVLPPHAKLGAEKKPCGRPLDLRKTKFRAFCKAHAGGVLDQEFTRLFSGGIGRGAHGAAAAAATAAPGTSTARTKSGDAPGGRGGVVGSVDPKSAVPSAAWSVSDAVAAQEAASALIPKKAEAATILSVKEKEAQVAELVKRERLKRKRAEMEKSDAKVAEKEGREARSDPPPRPALKRCLTPAQRMAFAAAEAQNKKDEAARKKRELAKAGKAAAPVEKMESDTAFVVKR